MKDLKNIYLLPTTEPSKIKGEPWRLELSSKALHWKEAKHIYITSGETIFEGDWCLDTRPDEEGVFQQIIYRVEDIKWAMKSSTEKKIVMSTDPALHLTGVQSINNGFIKWLIENPCEYVELQHTIKEYVDDQDAYGYDVSKYKIIIPKRQEAIELENNECSKEISQELTLEAKSYAKSKSSSESFQDTHIRDFVAGASSNFVKAQNIQAQIDCLQGILDKTSHLKDDGPTNYFILMQIQSLHKSLLGVKFESI